MQVFNEASLSTEGFDQILSVLRAGGVIGFPTDTAYGLAADPFNESAVARIFEIKGRSETKPLLLLVNSWDMLQQVAEGSEAARAVASRFWPGPLTVLLPVLSTVPRIVTAGTGSIGVRWAEAAFANRLLQAFGRPITATSANQSGMPAAVTAEEVRSQLGEKLEVLVDGGTLPSRGGSTILDLTAQPPILLREGPVTSSMLNEFFSGKIRRGDTSG